MTHISRTHRLNVDCFFTQDFPGSWDQIKYVNTSKKIADILTKGSFSCERWPLLTHLFNLVTPNMHINRESYRKTTRCLSVKKVRNLCAYAPHSASSSSSPNVNSQWNRARREPEQETNRLNSNVQKSQSSGVDKTILSGAERSLALKHEESEDPTLIHKPHDQASEALKGRVLLQNEGRKFLTFRRFTVSLSTKLLGETS